MEFYFFDFLFVDGIIFLFDGYLIFVEKYDGRFMVVLKFVLKFMVFERDLVFNVYLC